MEPHFPWRAGHPCEAPPHGSRPLRAGQGGAPVPASFRVHGLWAPLPALCLLLSACSFSSQNPATHLATVIRIEQPQGEFFSPRMQGQSRPLTKVYLRPSGGGTSRDGVLVVAVLGPYEPALLGDLGDVVSFTYPGPIQPGAEIPFEDLTGYEVVAKAPKPRA
jgi:hypothetical protein